MSNAEVCFEKRNDIILDSVTKQRDTLNEILQCKEKTVSYVKDSLHFLNQYYWIYDGHMTRIFCDSNSAFYSIPPEWLQPLLNLTPEELNEVPFGFVKEDWPESLKTFVKLALTLGQLRFFSDCLECYRGLPERALPVSLVRGMNPKKLQEVEGMARKVASLCVRSGCSSVLDVGAGMGYLDQVLHYRYGLTVLGVDAAFSHGAQERITNTSNLGGYCAANVTHVPFVLQANENSLNELHDLLKKTCPPATCPCQKEAIYQENVGWIVVALHACGNLTNSVLQFYRNCPDVRGLVCLSCCYHKMKTGAFPLSTSFRKCIFEENHEDGELKVLSPYALRLASQETRARWHATTPESHMKRADHTLYRATIEHALAKGGMQWTRPRRRIEKQAYENFRTYCDVALASYDDSVKHGALSAYETFKDHRNLLQHLTLLQVLLQPVVENLILLDRASYLKLDSEKKDLVWLEAVAPELLSPRNIAVLAIKEGYAT